jgi:Domain of unknown function (DUF4340)
MATAQAMPADKRRRNLMMLSGLTTAFVVLAVASVFIQASQLARKFDPRAFFPGLPSAVNQLGELVIQTKTATLHIKKTGEDWVIAEKGNFPASQAQMRAVAVGIADLQAMEPKTARADWLTYIGLGAPPDGDATRVTLSDAGGKTIADLLVGRREGQPDELGRSTLYVRKPDENQSWLARGYLDIKPDVTDWLDKSLVVIARDRVKGAIVTPKEGPSYTLSRENKDQQDFKLLDMPRGRELSFEGSPDGVAGAIVGFVFDDVAKADQFNFDRVPQQVSQTFDGLNLTVKIATKDGKNWASVTAAGTDDMTREEATKINARVSGWAFQIPESKVTQFVSPRETLLKPPAGK